jgi:hypothetical protein
MTTRPSRTPTPTRSTYGQRSSVGLAWQLRLALLLSLLAGGWCAGPAAAAWLETIVRERTQRLEQAAEPAE